LPGDQLDDKREFDGLCTVTLQGGGVLAFSLLGQLQAVLDRGETFKPVAYAGASAGGLVATLIWAGYTPEEARDRLADICCDRARLRDALFPGRSSLPGAWSAEPATVRQARDLINGIAQANGRGWLAVRARTIWSLFRLLGVTVSSVPSALRHRGLFNAGGFVDELDDLLREKLGKLLREAEIRARHRPIYDSYLKRIGLPDPDDEEFKAYRPRFMDFDLVRVTFGVNPSAPALVLSVTDVDRNEVVLIDSQHAAFSHLRVSDVVRATISFPGVFQPVEMKIVRDSRRKDLATRNSGMKDRDAEANERGIYLSQERFIDGGVLANTPTWALAEYIRHTMHGHTISEPREIIRLADRIDEDSEPELFTVDGETIADLSSFGRASSDDEDSVAFPLRPFAFRPMVHLGLTFMEDKQLEPLVSVRPKFFGNLIDLLTTGVRAWFERRATRSGDRFWSTRQGNSNLGWEFGILDFHELNPTRIKEMFETARDHVSRRLNSINFGLPAPNDLEVISRTAEEKTSIGHLLDESRDILEGAPFPPPQGDAELTGTVRLLLVRGTKIREYWSQSFGDGHTDGDYRPQELDRDEFHTVEHYSYFTRRVIAKQPSEAEDAPDGVRHVFDLAFPLHDLAVPMEQTTATTLRERAELFPESAFWSLSEKRDSVMFGFLVVECFCRSANPGNLAATVDEVWRTQLSGDHRPSGTFFKLAEIADRMSAYLTISFPGAPRKYGDWVDPVENKSVSELQPFEARGQKAMLEFFGCRPEE